MVEALVGLAIGVAVGSVLSYGVFLFIAFVAAVLDQWGA